MASHDQGKTGTASGREAPGVVFLFPGQGAQTPGMARGLYETEPVFREALTECSQGFEPLIGESLLDLLYGGQGGGDGKTAEALKQTGVAQPAMFSVEMALARLWESRGLRPSAMLGHSLGDFPAACLAGVFTLSGAITAIAARSRLMQACEPGAMLAVLKSREEVSRLLSGQDRVSLAGVNGPRNCVVAGSVEDIRSFAGSCARRGVETRTLRTSHAFHTERMRPAAEAFREALSTVTLAAPRIPMVSSRTGNLLTDEEATDPEFWAGQIVDPVLFHDGLVILGAEPGRVFLEVGPGNTLASLARQAGLAKTGTIVSSLGHATDSTPDRDVLEQATEALRQAGVLARHSSTVGQNATAPSGSSETAKQTDHIMSTPESASNSRLARVRSALADIFEEYSGLDVDHESAETTFLEMGFDSLFLTQIATALQNQFGVPMKFRRMLEDLCTLDRLAAFFDEVLPPEQFAEPAQASASVPSPEYMTGETADPSSGQGVSQAEPGGQPPGAMPTASASVVHAVVQEQLAIMRQQLALLAGTAGPADGTAMQLPAELRELQASAEKTGAPGATSRPADGVTGGPAGSGAPEKPQAFGAQARIRTDQGDRFTPKQRECFDAFLERYEAKTGQSKAFTETNRRVMADPRVVTGFQPLLKELVYPIVVERSSGSRLWDLDGNEYVDLTCGFGSNFLGNQPDFLANAIREQIDRGYEVGPQHPLTADVAELISELTGMERVAFCNTGSEAVMGALRAARTITGRSLVAIFKNSYHGIFDEVIVRGTKKLRSIAAAPGILASAVENVLVLDYGSPESLQILKERGHELAAIMAEPVQSRNPGLQPREFLHDLRAIADECGAALIFDEVITGFRIAPGGAQEHFGVRADLATYGKIIGGGLPFAAIAGGPRFMDALDGGHWAFGDDSYPEVGVTYFAGTFVRHPLALAAAKASLEHLKQQGPALQEKLNERTTGFVEGLRALFERTGAPIRVDHFASLFRVTVSEDEPFGSLLFYALRFRGVHIWEGFPTFLTTAHTEEDLRHLHEAFESSIRELQAGDLLSRSLGPARSASSSEHSSEPTPTGSTTPNSEGIPLTDAQREIWHAVQFWPDAACAYNESFTLELKGDLDVQAFKSAVDLVSARHEALRLRFDEEDDQQRVVAHERVDLPENDWRDMGEADACQAVEALLEHEATTPFDLRKGPVIRNALCRVADSRWVFLTTAHHIVFDGWSAGVYLDEIGSAYASFRQGREPDLPPAPSFVAYAHKEAETVRSESGKHAMDYWEECLRDPPPPLDLPQARKRPEHRSFSAGSMHWAFADATYQAARRAASRCNTTLYGFLLATFGAYLHRLTGQEDLVIGIPTAGQALTGDYGLIGNCVNTLPVRLRVSGLRAFEDFLAHTSRQLLDAQEHQPATLGSILRHVSVPRIPGRSPLVEVVFNLNRKLPDESFEGLKTRNREVGKRFTHWDMFLNCSEEAGKLTTDFDYNADLFDDQSIRDLLEGFEHLLASVSESIEQPIDKLPVTKSDTGRQPGNSPCVPRIEGKVGPASSAQQRLWFLDQLDGEHEDFTISLAWNLEGSIDVPALEQAVTLLGQRQEMLRTRFEQRGDELVQVIEPDSPPLEQRSTATLAHCKERVSELTQERLELEAGPPWRATLFTTPAGEHVLSFRFHQALLDRRSVMRVLRDLSACYRVALGIDADLPQQPETRFLDYAAWQNERIEGGAYSDQLRFWLNHLDGPLPVLNLPTDHRRPARRDAKGASLSLRLDPALTDALRGRVDSEGASLFPVLLAGFYALLERYSGQKDLIVGTPVSIHEIESSVGPFANTLALRLDLHDDPTLAEMIERTTALCAGAFANQDLPFEHLLSQLTLERDLSRTPVFQAQFALRDARENELVLADASATPFTLDRRSVPTDLAIWVEELGDGLDIEVEYAAGLFEAFTIEQMLGHYRQVLKELSENPRRRLSEVQWLSDAEFHQLTETWNATDRGAPTDTVLERFAAQVAERPDAVAVACNQVSLTYASLDRASDAIAGRLRALLEASQEQPVVGICMPRSEQLVVAILGIWKAGCAYVPLDPAFPSERLSFMVEDSGAAALLVDNGTEPPFGFDGPILITNDSHGDTEPVENRTVGELAYLIHTSGSTGKPKGVLVGHRQIINLLDSMTRKPGLGEGDILLAVTTLSFDISVLELLLPLVTGARLEIATREEAKDPQGLAQRIADSGATVMQATPSTWRSLLEGGWTGRAGLRALCGGEALTRDLAGELLPRVDSLWNLYGPTETTVWSTCEPITDPSQPISVGRPIDNTRVYILDEHQRLVPRGVTGELFIAGAGVAVGYHQREEQTCERFMPDPFHPGAGERMYRTGDLARHFPDGRIELLGRSDNQVKLRGSRIELGEIEAALRDQPGIVDAVTKVHELAPGDQRLVAYVTLEAGERLTVVALRKRLRQLLPDYMIPQAFEAMEALPLTPNGKVDRHRLPQPASFVAHREVVDPPATNAERQIATIWSELLGCSEISPTDNFFELGGHSLLAMQASRRIAETFGCRMPPQALVMQNLREIASEVEAPAVAL